MLVNDEYTAILSVDREYVVSLLAKLYLFAISVLCSAGVSATNEMELIQAKLNHILFADIWCVFC
jgi:hypothetical protein